MKIKLLITAVAAFCISTSTKAQNWQYVGSPFIHQNVTPAVNFADMEMTASGDIYVGYSSGNVGAELRLAKYSGGSWTQLPSPTVAGGFSGVDIELHGNDCYFAYEINRNNNYYIYIKKYDGTSWSTIGDSLLLGYIGNGSFFEFVVDNNGVPTILGVNGTGGKTVKQFVSGAWTTTITLAGTAATVFQENTAAFDSQNKLYCITTAVVTLTVPPYIVYANVVQKIDGSTRSTVGDTLKAGLLSSGRIKFDGTGNPYLVASSSALSRVLAYKLNTSTWSLVGDTTKSTGLMTCNAVTGDGKVVFCGMITSRYNAFIYSGSTVSTMDTFNISGAGLGSFIDIIVPAGSNDAYVLLMEIKAGATPDLSVMKHAVSGGSTFVEKIDLSNNILNIYPNPASEKIMVEVENASREFQTIAVFDMSGKLMLEQEITQTKNLIEVSNLQKGIYFVKAGTITKKLFIQ